MEKKIFLNFISLVGQESLRLEKDKCRRKTCIMAENKIF
jgi:hypothetical protein